MEVKYSYVILIKFKGRLTNSIDFFFDSKHICDSEQSTNRSYEWQRQAVFNESISISKTSLDN